MTTNTLTKKDRKAIYARDGYRCALCDSAKGLQVHHCITRAEGGSNQPENLICLCWKCHAVAHGTQMPEYPDYVTPEYIQQAVTEYLSDMYAGDWYPFGND